jgi:hypothetical protein
MTNIDANGFLVLTAINSEDGTADSETFKVDGTSTEYDPRGGMIQRFQVHDSDGDPEPWLVTLQRADAELPEVQPYRQLIQALIAADEPCQGIGCHVTMLGHLLASCTPEQVEMVKALDPDYREKM